MMESLALAAGLVAVRHVQSRAHKLKRRITLLSSGAVLWLNHGRMQHDEVTRTHKEAADVNQIAKSEGMDRE